MARFEDRVSAATELLPKLKGYMGGVDTVVVGLPRGGMVTASFLAGELKLPLDFIVVKKVGAPGNEELAIGAVTENGEVYFDENFVQSMGIEAEYKKSESERKKKEVMERSSLYRKSYPVLDLKDKTAILTDDGVATGTTMLAAIAAVRRRGAKKVVVAIPVASTEAGEKIKKAADELICLEVDPYLSAVGEYYNNFPQVEDGGVLKILHTAKAEENAKNNSFNK